MCEPIVKNPLQVGAKAFHHQEPVLLTASYVGPARDISEEGIHICEVDGEYGEYIKWLVNTYTLYNKEGGPWGGGRLNQLMNWAKG